MLELSQFNKLLGEVNLLVGTDACVNKKALFKSIKIVNPVKRSVLHLLTDIVYQVVVHEVLFHLAGDEAAYDVFEVGRVSPLDEKLKFVASELSEASVLLLGGHGAPLPELLLELSPVYVRVSMRHNLLDLFEDLEHFGNVIDHHNFRARDVFDELA